MKLSEEITHFFNKQSFIIVSTVDSRGNIHNSCKGLIQINKNGSVYLLDLYKKNTYQNLLRNKNVSLSAVNEYSFEGYCLEGKAYIVDIKGLKKDVVKSWEDRLATRITQRVLNNIQGKKGHSLHPEALLPLPEYLIFVKVKKIVNLTPANLVDARSR
jgi:uncharacterized pyridoxamine 5'-phosphate oxidase family protein